MYPSLLRTSRPHNVIRACRGAQINRGRPMGPHRYQICMHPPLRRICVGVPLSADDLASPSGRWLNHDETQFSSAAEAASGRLPLPLLLLRSSAHGAVGGRANASSLLLSHHLFANCVWVLARGKLLGSAPEHIELGHEVANLLDRAPRFLCNPGQALWLCGPRLDLCGFFDDQRRVDLLLICHHVNVRTVPIELLLALIELLI